MGLLVYIIIWMVDGLKQEQFTEQELLAIFKSLLTQKSMNMAVDKNLESATEKVKVLLTTK